MAPPLPLKETDRSYGNMRLAIINGHVKELISYYENGDQVSSVLGIRLLREIIDGYNYDFMGEPTYRFDPDKIAMDMAKVVLAGGLDIRPGSGGVNPRERIYFWDVMEHVKDIYPTLYDYLTDVAAGNRPMPTQEELTHDRIPFTLSKIPDGKAHAQFAKEQKARECNGIILQDDALYAEDYGPDLRLKSPLNVDGRVVMPDTEIKK